MNIFFIGFGIWLIGLILWLVSVVPFFGGNYETGNSLMIVGLGVEVVGIAMMLICICWGRKC